MLPRRGLNDTDQQGFEIFISKPLREIIKKVYGVVLNKSHSRTKKRIGNMFLNY